MIHYWSEKCYPLSRKSVWTDLFEEQITQTLDEKHAHMTDCQIIVRGEQTFRYGKAARACTVRQWREAGHDDDRAGKQLLITNFDSNDSFSSSSLLPYLLLVS